MAYDVVTYMQVTETKLGREYEGYDKELTGQLSYDDQQAVDRAVIAKKRLLRKYCPELPPSERAVSDLRLLQCLLRKYRKEGEPPCPT